MLEPPNDVVSTATPGAVCGKYGRQSKSNSGLASHSNSCPRSDDVVDSAVEDDQDEIKPDTPESVSHPPPKDPPPKDPPPQDPPSKESLEPSDDVNHTLPPTKHASPKTRNLGCARCRYSENGCGGPQGCRGNKPQRVVMSICPPTPPLHTPPGSPGYEREPFKDDEPVFRQDDRIEASWEGRGEFYAGKVASPLKPSHTCLWTCV